ncbi:ATP-binding protein [bacterium]|nr:ATP-binding protein [bacterium]
MKTARTSLQLTLASTLSNLKRLEQFSREIAGASGLAADAVDNLAIVLTEAVGNAIVHGNGSDPHKRVTIEAALLPDKLVITVTDQGKGFNPDELDDPLDPANLMKESGRGIFIMETLTDEIEYTFTESGTILRITMLSGGKK